MALMTLTYVSSATVPFSKPELGNLLDESRENNERLGISGMLLYKEGNFMRVIEGEEEHISALYSRINLDPRHKNVLRLRRERIAEREFADWSMGFRNLDSDRDVPGYSEFMNTPLTSEEFTGNPTRAHRLLLTFKRSM